jgi:hypothetical protein
MSLYLYALSLFLVQTKVFARGIRVDSCTVPFDFTIGSVCVLSTLMWWILAAVVIGFISSIFRSN